MILLNNLNEYNSQFIDEFKNNIEKVIKDNNYILGEPVKEFEKKLAEYIGTNYCLGVNSGTSALELAFSCFNLNDNDEIIIQSNAYIACALGTTFCNGKLKIIDCDLNGVFDVDECIKNINNKTKIILVVHLYGDCCNMEYLSFICKEKNIILIEDCAQSFGSMYNNKKLGSFGDISCFSFYPTKNLGALGDAGAICSNNEKYIEEIKKKRNLGSTIKYYNDIKGTNSRLDTLQALFLLSKFNDIDNVIKHKKSIASYYLNNIKNDIGKHIYNKDTNIYHSYHLFVIKLNSSIKRDDFIEYMKNTGIETLIHYKIPFYKSGAFTELNHLSFKNSEELSNNIVSIPIYNTINHNVMHYIIEQINNYNG